MCQTLNPVRMRLGWGESKRGEVNYLPSLPIGGASGKPKLTKGGSFDFSSLSLVLHHSRRLLTSVGKQMTPSGLGRGAGGVSSSVSVELASDPSTDISAPESLRTSEPVESGERTDERYNPPSRNEIGRNLLRILKL